jgi:hypothetical protein
MTAVKKRNQMGSENDIDWCVIDIDCCQWQFMNHHIMILNCSHGTVTSHLGRLVKP